MTAPICHGTAGGCTVSHWSHLSIHTASCPTLHCIGCPQDVDGPASIHYTNCPLFTPPTKRAMGQCSDECQQWRLGNGSVAVHLAACPAIYPLQRQPGDEKDALTRLTAHVRTARDTENPDGWESQALALISEAREDGAVLRVERDGANERAKMLLDAKNDIAEQLRAELARAKALVTTLSAERDAALAGMTKASSIAKTLTLQQSEVRQQAFRDMAAEMWPLDSAARIQHLLTILDAAKDSTS